MSKHIWNWQLLDETEYNVKGYIIYVDSPYNKVPVHSFVITRLQSSDVS